MNDVPEKAETELLKLKVAKVQLKAECGKCFQTSKVEQNRKIEQKSVQKAS